MRVYIQEWTKYFNPLTEKYIFFLMWVNLYHILVEFQRKKVIFKIRNTIGKFQDLDDYIMENVDKQFDMSDERFFFWMNANDPQPHTIFELKNLDSKH